MYVEVANIKWSVPEWYDRGTDIYQYNPLPPLGSKLSVFDEAFSDNDADFAAAFGDAGNRGSFLSGMAASLNSVFSSLFTGFAGDNRT